ELLWAVGIGKLVVLLVVFLAFRLLPFFTDQFQLNFVDPNHPEVNLAAALTTWDAQHYLYLSESGYQPGQESNAFFPLFPLLIHILAPVLGGSVGAGLVISNVASLAGF